MKKKKEVYALGLAKYATWHVSLLSTYDSIFIL
jgi:hypothetical protein